MHVATFLGRRSDAPVTELSSIAEVSTRVPHAVICLLSALQLHVPGTRAPPIAIQAKLSCLPDEQARALEYAGCGVAGEWDTERDQENIIDVGHAHVRLLRVRAVSLDFTKWWDFTGE